MGLGGAALGGNPVTWIVAGEVSTITRARKTVIDVDGYEVLVLAHDGNLHAFQNRCIHKQRELAKGVVLNGKLVCPGHQWAFALDSGWESIKDECQPMFPVRVVEGVVEVDVTVPEPESDSGDLTGSGVVRVDVGGSADARSLAED
jgi:nitrite reductase (NADH) small subunit